MAFHGHWQSGQLLSRVTTDLSSIRRFSGFGLIFLIINITQLTVVTGVLLHMYWPLGLVVVAAPRSRSSTCRCASSGLRASSPGACRTSRATSPPSPRRAPSASG